MVAAHPNLQRRFNNVDNIVKANKSGFVPNLYTKYPRDYVDLYTHSKLDTIRPWIEESSIIKKLSNKKSNKKQEILRSQIIDRILVLCVDFDDRPATISTATIYNRFFSDIGKSFKNYYKEVSYNQYIPEGEVHGWYRAPYNSTWYTSNNYGLGTYPFDARKLVEDVIDIASTDPNINWPFFDTNNNGYLDNVIIVHSGAEAAATGNINDFWAHVWETVFPKTIQGKTIQTYALSAEYIYSPIAPQVCGVDCHEFGHLLYLPDLYDYSGNSNGVGNYSIMGSGSWTDFGITPTHLDAWSKYVLGYIAPIINPIGTTYIRDAETNSESIKYTTADPREYFLIENRQTKLFDTYLPAYGLLIWHINENQSLNDDKSCFLVGLIQADGMRDLENKTNYGDGGDSFPGLANNHSFGVSTIPNSLLCNGNTQDISITNISNSADIMSFDSILLTPVGSIKFIVYPPGSEIYFGSILQGTTDITTGILTIDNIPVGTVNYTVKKIGYYDRTGSAIVTEGGTTTVSIILGAIPLTGSLSIISNPSGAKIYIDDIDTGLITPASKTDLTPRDHTYKLTLTGFYNKTGIFTITAGQTTNIDVGDLQTQVAQAGFGSPVGIILITGLVVGSIYSSMIKPKMSKT